MVVAHSDDEVLFAGGQMARMRKLCIVHTTDSAPSRSIAAGRGFASRRAYARAREAELHAALAAGGIEAECINFGYRDSALCLRLGAAVRRLARLIDARTPEVLLTQAYDGGHIDHDTTAAVVQFALERCEHRPAVWEMGGYYVADGEKSRHRLLPREGDAGIVITLAEAERTSKAAMLARFESQQHVVRNFGVESEVLREVRPHDFGVPPLVGRLGYDDDVGRGVDPVVWRALVSAHQRRREGMLTGTARLLLPWVAMWLLIVTRRQRRLHPRAGRPIERICLVAVKMARRGTGRRVLEAEKS